MSRFFAWSLAGLIGACAPVGDTGSDPTPGHGPANGCASVTSSDWEAWINAMPGPGARRTLFVTGTATAPSGGWRLALAPPIVTKSNPVELSFALIAERPQGMATQALETHRLRAEVPDIAVAGRVTIHCEGKPVAVIDEILIAR